MIFVTGDIHGNIDIDKLLPENFPEGSELTRDDYVIICGDFGLLWEDSDIEHYWLGWLNSMPWTTLWIDGNHENFDIIADYPVEEWNGGMIQKITDNIFHLCRGRIFTIEDKRIFAFGGAESHDKEFRIEGQSYWTAELPTEEEIAQGRKVLEEAGWHVDYVITHSLPTDIQTDLFGESDFPANRLTDFFEEVSLKLDFKLWFSGHYHQTLICDDKYFLLYNDIIRLSDDLLDEITDDTDELTE